MIYSACPVCVHERNSGSVQHHSTRGIAVSEASRSQSLAPPNRGAGEGGGSMSSLDTPVLSLAASEARSTTPARSATPAPVCCELCAACCVGSIAATAACPQRNPGCLASTVYRNSMPHCTPRREHYRSATKACGKCEGGRGEGRTKQCALRRDTRENLLARLEISRLEIWNL